MPENFFFRQAKVWRGRVNKLSHIAPGLFSSLYVIRYDRA